LSCACFFTFGDINKQAQIRSQLRTKSKHKATFVCLLALLLLFATQGKQALARDRSKTFYLTFGFASISPSPFYLIFLSHLLSGRSQPFYLT
jgi:hypothetical protein